MRVADTRPNSNLQTYQKTKCVSCQMTPSMVRRVLPLPQLLLLLPTAILGAPFTGDLASDMQSHACGHMPVRMPGRAVHAPRHTRA